LTILIVVGGYHCLVLVGSRKGFESDFTINNVLTNAEGLIAFRRKSSLIKIKSNKIKKGSVFHNATLAFLYHSVL